MSQGHTEGLLIAKSGGVIVGGPVRELPKGPVQSQIAAICCTDDAEQDENTRRLVACWNAFDGIPTEKFAGKSVADYVCQEAYITGMEPVEGAGMELGLRGTALQMFASSFAGQFKANDAINFLEVRMSHPETGPLLVTMQRLEGETPAQQKNRVQLRLDVAHARLDRARTLLSDALETFDDNPAQDHEVADRIRAFLKGAA